MAVLLSRPHAPRNETVNDKDCYLSNFWRALQFDPEQVAYWADWPVNEADLHSRHRWLVNQTEFRERMMSDPDYFDSKIAGWWVWGLSLWIGSGWCVRPEWSGRAGCHGKPRGVHVNLPQKRVQIKRGNNGVCRSEYTEITITRKLPHIRDGHGNGTNRGVHADYVSRQLPDISGDGGATGRGVHAKYASGLTDYLCGLSRRLRKVRVCCGDWSRILGPSPTTKIGLTAVFLDPPYGVQSRADVYAEESRQISADVFRWAAEHGDNPMLRIAVCGYEGEHDFPSSWECVAWKANGGYGNQGDGSRGRSNAGKERIWFSPHCLRNTLFGNEEVA